MLTKYFNDKIEWELKYGELAKDEEFVLRFETLKHSLMELQETLDKLVPLRAHYDEMSLPQKIEFDIFLAYSMNSLKWVYLRILGQDPNELPIKDELDRTRIAMTKWQEIKDLSKRPMVDKKAAKRFIQSGLYDKFKGTGQPKNKKIKFDVD